MIEFLKLNDVFELTELAKEMHLESRFNNKTYIPKKLMELCVYIINNPDKGCAFIYKKDNKIVGMMLGSLQDYFFGDEFYAQDILLYVTPECRGSHIALKLIKAYEKWAKELNVVEIVISQSTGVNIATTTKFFKALDYVETGANMRKDL